MNNKKKYELSLNISGSDSGFLSRGADGPPSEGLGLLPLINNPAVHRRSLSTELLKSPVGGITPCIDRAPPYWVPLPFYGGGRLMYNDSYEYEY
jgi:hypothetical protein